MSSFPRTPFRFTPERFVTGDSHSIGKTTQEELVFHGRGAHVQNLYRHIVTDAVMIRKKSHGSSGELGVCHLRKKLLRSENRTINAEVRQPKTEQGMA